MGRTPRVFSRAEIDDLVGLFDLGESTERIGQLRGLSGAMVRRVLRAELGTDLRAARAERKTRRGNVRASRHEQAAQIARELGQGRTSQDYREGFEAGARQAVAWVERHGSEAVRRHCNEALLPWRDKGLGAPPPL